MSPLPNHSRLTHHSLRIHQSTTTITRMSDLPSLTGIYSQAGIVVLHRLLSHPPSLHISNSTAPYLLPIVPSPHRRSYLTNTILNILFTCTKTLGLSHHLCPSHPPCQTSPSLPSPKLRGNRAKRLVHAAVGFHFPYLISRMPTPFPLLDLSSILHPEDLVQILSQCRFNL